MRFVSLALLALISTAAHAGPIPTGTYSGVLCDYNVTYRFESQDNIRSYGRMYIADAEDRIEAYRNSNGGVVITRFLSGPYAGQTQWFSSYAPEIKWKDAKRYTFYSGPSGGPFCKSGGNIWIPTPG